MWGAVKGWDWLIEPEAGNADAGICLAKNFILDKGQA